MHPNWRKTVVSSGVALVLAGAGSLWIALWPSLYQGVSQYSGPAGSLPLPPIKVSASYLQVNGFRGIIPLLLPVLLAMLGFLSSRSAAGNGKATRISLWGIAVLLLLFCGAAMFSIGMYYLPSAVAMLTAAVFSLQTKNRMSA